MATCPGGAYAPSRDHKRAAKARLGNRSHAAHIHAHRQHSGSPYCRAAPTSLAGRARVGFRNRPAVAGQAQTPARLSAHLVNGCGDCQDDKNTSDEPGCAAGKKYGVQFRQGGCKHLGWQPRPLRRQGCRRTLVVHAVRSLPKLKDHPRQRAQCRHRQQNPDLQSNRGRAAHFRGSRLAEHPRDSATPLIGTHSANDAPQRHQRCHFGGDYLRSGVGRARAPIAAPTLISEKERAINVLEESKGPLELPAVTQRSTSVHCRQCAP